MDQTDAQPNPTPRDTTGQTWGRINAGQSYGLLALDIAAALNLLGLPKYEGFLFNEVRKRTWTKATRARRRGAGWPDAPPCRLNLAKLARALQPDTRRARSVLRQIRRAKQALLAKHILAEHEGGRLTINKNVDEWPLEPHERAYARREQPQPAPAVTIQSPTGGDSIVTLGVTIQSPQGCPTSHPEGDNPVTPPSRNARGDSIEIQGEKHTPCVRGDTHRNGSRPGGGGEDPEAERLARLAEELLARRRRAGA